MQFGADCDAEEDSILMQLEAGFRCNLGLTLVQWGAASGAIQG